MRTGQSTLRGTDFAFQGVLSILGPDARPDASEVVTVQKKQFTFPLINPPGGAGLPLPVYQSQQRRLALVMCGWGFEGAPQDLEAAVVAYVLGVWGWNQGCNQGCESGVIYWNYGLDIGDEY